ncbi:MAG: phytoene desaturase [Spirochaetaceae bacterium]|nr:MAG: phytoene desaturase [Spirochaetaceae bacterium]
MKKRIIVVGGGFGGLSAAAHLAHQGWDVTLLEKNDQVGGRARVWKTDGFTFDMGPSWYLMPEVFEEFFRTFGVERSSYYDIYRLDPYYRVFFSPEEKVDISADRAAVERVFDQLEPGGAEKLRRYLAQAEYKYNVAMGEFLYKEYRNIFQFLNRRLMTEGLKLNVFSKLDNFVERYFKDRRAKQILEYAMVFLGSSPKNAPALYSIMSHVDLNLGVYFPHGGMTSLVGGLSKLLTELGVTVELNAPVDQILVEDGKAVGVRSRGDSVRSDAVLVNADYPWAEMNLLQPEHRTYSAKYWNGRVLAPTMFIVYLGLNRKLPQLVHHNLYFTDPWDDHFADIFDRPRWPETFSYYISCASFDDPTVAPADHENLFFLVPVAAGLDDTDEIRAEYYERVLSHFEQLIGERVRDSIVVSRIYSHRDFSADYNAFAGSALGLSHTLGQTAVFRPSHRSKKVDRLFYSGQYTHPGVGVPMTFISSKIISEAVTRELA